MQNIIYQVINSDNSTQRKMAAESVELFYVRHSQKEKD